jgi:flagellar basal body-associated protein FliL
MEITFIDIAQFFSGLYSLILILLGTPLNLLCFYIFTRLVPNRSNSTIIVFAHLALIELLIPFTWNINYAVRELLWKYQKNISLKNLEQHSLFICKLISFGAYFSLQCAAWLKTLATFARCVSVHQEWSIKKWLSRPIIIHRVIWMVIFLVGLINFPIWFINGERVLNRNESNQTNVSIKCYQSKFFQFWEIVHLLLYNFIPFALMILCNILIVRQVSTSRRRTQRSKFTSNHHRPKGSRLTKTLVLITIFFIIFTAPAAIFYILFGKRFKRRTHRDLITMNLSNLATTSHVTSFIIYWLISGDFRNAAISILFCRPLVTPHRVPTTEERHEHKSPSLTKQSNDENQRKSLLVQIPSITIE